MNDFQDCLAQSHSASDLPFWEECYSAAFPSMQGMHDHRQDGLHQRQGIDRSVVLRNGQVVWIDEKVRGRNKITGKVYTDIALEEWSDERTKSPGWIIKPLFAHYIAYAIVPIGTCYLLPVIQLQQAWLENSTDWKLVYRRREAKNNGWTTIFWPVPPNVLFAAIGKCLRIQFKPIEDYQEP
jgi:hypothetical protein